MSSTSATIFNIQTLFDVPGEERITAKQALSGRFTQKLASTADYAISLVTYINCQLAGCPQCGVEYEVEFFATSKKRTFDDVDSLTQFVDAYVQNQHNVQAISFDLAGVDRALYEFKKSGSSGRRSIIQFPSLNVSIVEAQEVNGADAGWYTGFIRTDDILAMQPVWGALRASFNKDFPI